MKELKKKKGYTKINSFIDLCCLLLTVVSLCLGIAVAAAITAGCWLPVVGSIADFNNFIIISIHRPTTSASPVKSQQRKREFRIQT